MKCYDRIIISMVIIILSWLLSSGWNHDSRLWAQKLGEVSGEELALTLIPEDPEADAVVLFDKGEMVITPQFTLQFTQHRRLKILTERGKKYADIAIPYWNEEVVDRIDAYTILPNRKKIKLDKKNIFEKRNNLFKEKVFAFPGVEVGAILDYRYEKNSDALIMLHPWYFQNYEFTRMSELSVYLPSGFNYNVFFANISGINPDPIKEEILTPGAGGAKKIGKFTWRLENLPAIKEEPYITNMNDYLTALHFQLISYRDAYQNFEFIKTWDDLAEQVWPNYKLPLNENQQLSALAAELSAGIQDPNEKIKKLYDYVRSQIESTPNNFLFDNDLKLPSQVLKTKKGSGVEKNLLLINLLTKAGFVANPVLISTRSNGRFITNQVHLQQFNHLLACVNLDAKKIFLDTEDRFCPFGLVPPDDLAEQGLLISEKKGELVPIPFPVNINMEHASTQAILTDSSEFLCESLIRFEGYRGVVVRNEITDKGDKKYVEKYLKQAFDQVSLDSFRVENLDEAEAPLVIKLNYRIPNYAQVNGDLIYVSPPLLHSFQHNPFQREKRTFPVDFTYRRSMTEELNILLPAGLEVIELPKQKNYQSSGLKFICACDRNANTVRFQRQVMLSRSVFASHEYPELRNIYDRLVNTAQGQMVLRRAQEVANAK